MRAPKHIRDYYGEGTDCHAGSDGDCVWKKCPQLKDGEPNKSGRHCPLDAARGQEKKDE